jgi:hypothetical protein
VVASLDASLHSQHPSCKTYMIVLISFISCHCALSYVSASHSSNIIAPTRMLQVYEISRKTRAVESSVHVDNVLECLAVGS